MYYNGFYAYTEKNYYMDLDGYDCIKAIVIIGIYESRGGYAYFMSTPRSSTSTETVNDFNENENYYNQVAKNFLVYLKLENDYAFAKHVANYVKESVYETSNSSTSSS